MFFYFFISYFSFILLINYLYSMYFLNTVYIIRGISGSGKSHLVKHLINNTSSYINNIELNIYDIMNFDNTITTKKLVQTYNKCFYYYIKCLHRNINHIYITNPFIHKWEYLNYIELAKKYNYKVKIIELKCNSNDDLQICYNRSSNVKNYNLLKTQYEEFEHDENSEIINIE